MFGSARSYAAHAILLFAAGCPNGESNLDAQPDAAEIDSGARDVGAPDAEAEDAEAPDVGVGCAAPTAGPTMHGGSVTSTETWTADGSPHVIRGDLTIAAAGTVIIEPCAEVRIGPGLYFYVSGRLIARGEPDRTITFTQRDAGQRWASIQVYADALLDLAHTTIEGGGGAINSTGGASIRVQGLNEVPIRRPIRVDGVTVRDSAGVGILLFDTAGFTSDSRDLTITGTGIAPGTSPISGPYPLRINLNALGTIPSGQYTGNGADEIWLVGDSPSSSLSVDATLADHGVPYRVGGRGANPELRVANEGGAPATLTIEPGVELRFERNASFTIGRFTGDTPPVGVLVAVGTSADPILFTSSSTTPAAGDWIGLSFANTLSPENRLDYVTVAYAGAPCGCSGFSCGPALAVGIDDEAAIILFNDAPSAFITNSTILRSAAHGITRGWRGTADVSFLPSNTFIEVAGCRETYPKDENGGCPATPPCPM